jgi:hypothetical protein
MTPEPALGIVLTWILGLVSYVLWRRASSRPEVQKSRYTILVRRASLVLGLIVGAIVALLTFEFVRLEVTGERVGLDTVWIVGTIAVTAMLYFAVIVSDVYALWALLRGPSRGGAALAIVGGPILAIVLLVLAGMVLANFEIVLSSTMLAVALPFVAFVAPAAREPSDEARRTGTFRGAAVVPWKEARG